MDRLRRDVVNRLRRGREPPAAGSRRRRVHGIGRSPFIPEGFTYPGRRPVHLFRAEGASTSTSTSTFSLTPRPQAVSFSLPVLDWNESCIALSMWKFCRARNHRGVGRSGGCLIVVSSLVAGLMLLVISVVGFAKSFGFVMKAADAVGDVGAIAPEHAAPTGGADTPGSPVSSPAEPPAPPSGAGGSEPNPSALPKEIATGPVGGASGSGGALPASDTTAQNRRRRGNERD